MLKENIALNGFDIVPFQQAVSNHDDVINIGDYTGGTADLTVQSVALDTFINKNAIKRIDLMKIDVETHEPQVLEGYSRYISQHKPTILIEILEQEIADKINAMVDGLGYLYFNIDEKGSIRQTAKIEKSDYFNYLLCDSETASRVGLVKAYSNV
jgi:hypothetical protein